MKRRSFLKKSTTGLAALVGGHFAPEPERVGYLPQFNAPQGRIEAKDERFWSMVREQFPLTKERIYLNTGSLGPSPYPVIEAVQNKIMQSETISESGHNQALWTNIKQKAAQILGCLPIEIACTRNATEGINIVCNGLPLKRGDEVITTSHEHVGNTIAWLARQKRHGIGVKIFEPSTQSAQENLDRIEQLITDKTRVLSIPHVTTTTGQILPVREIGQLASKHDLWYFVDGAQAAGMLPLNISEMNCHAYATSGHKWLLGPKGTGLLYVREDALDTIQAKWVGAYSNTGPFDIASGQFQFHPSAQRYEYGTVSVPLFVGLGAAMDFLLKIGIANVWRRNLALTTALRKGLSQLEVEVLSPPSVNEHSSMITVRMPGVPYRRAQAFLAKEFKLRTRGIYEAGLDAVRISLHIYNSFDEVQRVIEGVAAVQKQR